MERLRHFLHPADEGKGILVAHYRQNCDSVFNPVHPRTASDDRLTNLDHREAMQIVERTGLSDRQRRGPIELWDSGADQIGGMRRPRGSRLPRQMKAPGPGPARSGSRPNSRP
jgi:hypothetical protein